MARYRKYAPFLTYLVTVKGMYVHPSRTYYTAGSATWADTSLQFDSHSEAKRYAKSVHGRVVKLRVSAVQEPISGLSLDEQHPHYGPSPMIYTCDGCKALFREDCDHESGGIRNMCSAVAYREIGGSAAYPTTPDWCPFMKDN